MLGGASGLEGDKDSEEAAQVGADNALVYGNMNQKKKGRPVASALVHGIWFQGGVRFTATSTTEGGALLLYIDRDFFSSLL